MIWLLLHDAAVSRLVTSNTGGAKYMPLPGNLKGLFFKEFSVTAVRRRTIVVLQITK